MLSINSGLNFHLASGFLFKTPNPLQGASIKHDLLFREFFNYFGRINNAIFNIKSTITFALILTALIYFRINPSQLIALCFPLMLQYVMFSSAPAQVSTTHSWFYIKKRQPIVNWHLVLQRALLKHQS
jgi:hypothetical protein